LRGGSESDLYDDEVIDLDAPPASPPDEETRILAASGATGSSTALLAFGRVYSNYLETHPIATKSVTAAVLFAISDQMAQAFEIQRARKRGTDKSTAPILTSTDKKRSMWSGLVGFTYFGPTSHYWCVKKKFIPNICSVLFFFCHDDSIHLTVPNNQQHTSHRYAWVFRAFPSKSTVSILQKAALGQFFFAPPLFCVFFAAALLQNGQFTLRNWWQKIKRDLVKGWVGGLGFWPICNYISYGYVPPKYIPLFINCCGLIFNIYVSLIANLKQGGQQPKIRAKAKKA